MSDHAQRFIMSLDALNGGRAGGVRDAGALAALRHSLAFAPGTHAKSFPYVEPFLGKDLNSNDGWRLAHYVVAGLFAIHPVQQNSPFAASLGGLARDKGRKGGGAGLERRFIALLGADETNVHQYLRQLIVLLSQSRWGCDYAALLDDLSAWMNPRADLLRRDGIRQRWARQFYQIFSGADNEDIDDAVVA